MPVATIRPATPADVPLVLRLIHELADYEKLAHEVSATEADLHESLFGPRPIIEVLIAEAEGDAAGYALCFHNYSTFLCKRGLYLEDLFVRPPFRGRGIGKMLLSRLAKLAVERGSVRLERAEPDCNAPASAVYRSLGARPLEDWTEIRVTGDALQRLAATGR
jgi:GNAT superfamily N-acetyltransferase